MLLEDGSVHCVRVQSPLRSQQLVDVFLRCPFNVTPFNRPHCGIVHDDLCDINCQHYCQPPHPSTPPPPLPGDMREQSKPYSEACRA